MWLKAAMTWTGAGIAAGQGHPKVLRAESIELVDQRGRVRVKLRTTADGSTGLVLMDQSIEPTLWLETDRSGTSITLVQAGRDALLRLRPTYLI